MHIKYTQNIHGKSNGSNPRPGCNEVMARQVRLVQIWNKIWAQIILNLLAPSSSCGAYPRYAHTYPYTTEYRADTVPQLPTVLNYIETI